MMRILVLYSSKNTHGNDAVGAFIPQAMRFAKSRRAVGDVVDLVPFDPTIADRATRRARFLSLIEAAEPFDAFVYFGHGLRTGLPSAGFTLATLPALVSALRAKSRTKRLIVTLYACSTANTPLRGGVDGDGGFADRLRDLLSLGGVSGWIDAHTVAGHTTINRMTRRFYMDGKTEGVGGGWIVAMGSPEWRAWGAALKSDESFRFGFPYMTETDIVAHLAQKSSTAEGR